MAIFDTETGKELPYGQMGEVCSSGPNTMLGYFNNEAETEKVLKTHEDGQVWVHSGDLGYMDEDGCLFIVGRIKRMIVRVDGFKVFPTQVEDVIMTSSNVADCCVVATPDKDNVQGDLPIVFAVLKDNADEQKVKNELFELCEAELPEYAQPIDFIFIDKLPLTSIGKVDYRKLEEMAKGN